MFGNILNHSFLTAPLRCGATVLDLGASTAEFSHRIALAHHVNCHAYEAHPANFAAIVENERVTKHNFLVGAHSEGSLEVAEHENGFAWVSAGLSNTGMETGGSFTVQNISLGKILKKTGVEYISLVKVDIEGGEFDFFAGASDEEILRCEQFTIEFHDFIDPRLAPKVKVVRERLEGLGYRWLRFSQHTQGDVLVVKIAVLPSLWFLYFAFTKYGGGFSRILTRLRPWNRKQHGGRYR